MATSVHELHRIFGNTHIHTPQFRETQRPRSQPPRPPLQPYSTAYAKPHRAKQPSYAQSYQPPPQPRAPSVRQFGAYPMPLSSPPPAPAPAHKGVARSRPSSTAACAHPPPRKKHGRLPDLHGLPRCTPCARHMHGHEPYLVAPPSGVHFQPRPYRLHAPLLNVVLEGGRQRGERAPMPQSSISS